MKQVVQDVRKGKVKMMDVPVPACGAGEVLVRVEASLISAGTEKMVMDFAGKGLVGKAKARPDLVKKVVSKMKKDGVAETLASVFARLDEPLPLGYSVAGEVVAVGAKLQGEFKIGDKVAGAGAGLANHAQFVALPKNLVVKVPTGVAMQEACYATLGAIALHGMRNAGVGIGDRVLVVGLGLVGQLVVQLCAAAGARVAGLDTNAARCALAVEGGAAVAVGPGDEGLLAGVHDGRGFDAVLLCAASESDALMQLAADLARDKARVMLVGKVGTRFDYASYMKKELTVGVSRSYGAGRYDPAFEAQGLTYPVGYVPHTERDNLAEVVRLIGLGKVKPALLTTHVFDFAEALKAYEMIGGKAKFMGVVLAYASGARMTENGERGTAVVLRDEVGIAVLGVGAFARSVLVPGLVAAKGARLLRLVSKGGLSAAATRDKLVPEAMAGTDAGVIFEDDAVHGVVIATRHDAHAKQVCETLAAGKSVWVEKPLAMTATEVEKVEKAYAKALKASEASGDDAPVVMVGYNRRFSPFIVPLKAAVDKAVGVEGARQVLIRVNAGKLDDGNWQTSGEGGGRLVGEVCHFVDLAQYFCGEIVKADKVVGAGQDVYAITLTHANGSVSSIVYSSEGDTAESKERLEVFAGGGVGVMDNYKTTTWSLDGKKRVLACRKPWQRVDKGHRAALAAWVKALQGEDSGLPSATELMAGARIVAELANG